MTPPEVCVQWRPGYRPSDREREALADALHGYFMHQRQGDARPLVLPPGAMLTNGEPAPPEEESSDGAVAARATSWAFAIVAVLALLCDAFEGGMALLLLAIWAQGSAR